MLVIIDMLYYYRYAVEQTLCQALLRASCEFVMLFDLFAVPSATICRSPCDLR